MLSCPGEGEGSLAESEAEGSAGVDERHSGQLADAADDLVMSLEAALLLYSGL